MRREDHRLLRASGYYVWLSVSADFVLQFDWPHLLVDTCDYSNVQAPSRLIFRVLICLLVFR